MRTRPHRVLMLMLLFAVACQAQVLQLPRRSPDTPTWREFAASVSKLPLDAREDHIYQQVTSGNVPHFMLNLVPITVTATAGGSQHTLTYYVLPDYLAIGSDDEYLLMPMTPILAQRIADTTRCILPTKKMVDDIYRTATVKLAPKPIPPTPAMITMQVFSDHNDSVWRQRAAVLTQYPLGALVGGDKKDVIVSNAVYINHKPAVPRPVVIYGWHQLNGAPIQPLYNGHEETYADYSHGVRLVQNAMILDGLPVSFAVLARDSALCVLVSDEGVIAVPRYDNGAH